MAKTSDSCKTILSTIASDFTSCFWLGRQSSPQLFVDRTIMVGPNELEMIQFDEAKRTIDMDFHEGVKLEYIYDFGCDWAHQIVVEKEIDQSSPQFNHAVCLKARGKRHLKILVVKTYGNPMI